MKDDIATLATDYLMDQVAYNQKLEQQIVTLADALREYASAANWRDELVTALAIMDEKGREDREGCVGLWPSEWDRLRGSLAKCLDGVKTALAAVEER